jgi:hypothetical protein
MCTFFNRRCRSENSEALHYLKLWYSFYIRVEYKRLHENNLAQRAQLMCPGRHWIGGGRGGKGGAMRAYQKWSCTTPYFLVIAEDQEGWEAFSEAFSSISSFLIWLLVICDSEKILLLNKK